MVELLSIDKDFYLSTSRSETQGSLQNQKYTAFLADLFTTDRIRSISSSVNGSGSLAFYFWIFDPRYLVLSNGLVGVRLFHNISKGCWRIAARSVGKKGY